MDAGGGWLIFALPPAELAAHPAEEGGQHELYLMCDDVHATVAELKAKGVDFARHPQRRGLRARDRDPTAQRRRPRALPTEARIAARARAEGRARRARGRRPRSERERSRVVLLGDAVLVDVAVEVFDTGHAASVAVLLQRPREAAPHPPARAHADERAPPARAAATGREAGQAPGACAVPGAPFLDATTSHVPGGVAPRARPGLDVPATPARPTPRRCRSSCRSPLRTRTRPSRR